MSPTTSTASHSVTTKRHSVDHSRHNVDDGADVLGALLERPRSDLDPVAMLETLEVVEHGQRLRKGRRGFEKVFPHHVSVAQFCLLDLLYLHSLNAK